jgi:uncharacterized protein YdhG (YjbR/CyaY superfamily)
MATRKAGTIDEFLAGVNAEQRAALETLRKDIQSAAPDAVEYVNYGVPAFRLHGKMLAGFGASANHCALYPGSLPIEVHAKELEEYDTSKGAIRFQPEKPLPAALVRKLVRTQAAELAPKARAGSTSRKTTKRQTDGGDFLSAIPAPARRALESHGVTTLKKLAGCSEDEILKLHGVGPGSIPKLRAALAKGGLAFRKG